MNVPSKQLELKLLREGYRHIIAVDEVGVGCLAGPVVVCAVLFDGKFFSKKNDKLKQIRDSKLLSAKKRKLLARELHKEMDIIFRIGYCYPKTIDRVNIYKATRLAMRRAVRRFAVRRAMVLVDGKYPISGLRLRQKTVIRGDEKIFSIACASVIAKVYRDNMMVRYAKRYPHYGFEKHKGYGTVLHITQLAKHGPCPIHRVSFKPVVSSLDKIHTTPHTMQ